MISPEIVKRINVLTDEAVNILTEPEVLKNDMLEHSLYSVVRTLSKLVNEINRYD